MSMEKLDSFVSKLTERLGMDRELQADVARELKTHLEEAVEEYRASGMSEEESAEAAMKHFGTRDELAEEIWRANRGRMRVRALLKWVLRLTLAPAALAFTVFYFYEPYSLSRSLSGGEELLSGTIVTDVNNPVHYANHVISYLAANREKIKDRASPEFTEVFAKLQEGERLEPDNAFYDYLKASILMAVSSTVEGDPERTYKAVDRHGNMKEHQYYKVSITDKQMFEEGVKKYIEGNGKPFYNSHVWDMLELRLEMLPPPSSLIEQQYRISMGAGLLLPHLALERDLVRRLCGYAILIADEGRAGDAIPLLETLRELAHRFAGSSRTLIEILVARGCQSVSLQHMGFAYEKLGMADKAEAARKEEDSENAFFNSLWTDRYQTYSDEEVQKYAGVLNGLAAPALMGYELPLAPMRTVEQVMGETGALGLLLLTLCLVLAACGTLTSWSLWSCRGRGDGPMLYFVGWKRLGTILLASLLFPAGLYILYTRFLPFGGRIYGINYSQNRFALELLLVVTTIFWAMLITGYMAIRQRVMEAGIEVPGPGCFQPGIVWKVTGAALLILLAVFFAWWENEAFRKGLFGFFMLGAVFAFSLIFFFRQAWRLFKLKGSLVLFRRTFLRSLLPILASCILLVGIACRHSLKETEKANINALNQPGTRLFVDELEYTAFKHYRDHLGTQKSP